MNLYLIRGLPGSGKSTLAKTLQAKGNAMHLEADQWQMEEVADEEGNFDGQTAYVWRAERVAFSHSECQRMCDHYMQMGLNIIVSNTFTTEKEMKPYIEMARQHGYHVTTMIVENRHGNPSVHNVPEETMTKMRNRFSVKL